MTEDKKQKSSGKKKVFYEVEAPLTATKIHLYGSSAEELEGKNITLDLTRSLRGKSLELKMKIYIEDRKLKALPMKVVLVGSYIRRVMRRGIDYVEDSFDVECRDAIAKIKPFLITRKKVSRVVRNTLRINARKYLEGYLKIRTVKEIFSEIITNKLPRGIAVKLKKIYPLALCEIRVFEVIKEKEGGRMDEGKDEKFEEIKMEEPSVIEELSSEEGKEEKKRVRRIEEEGIEKEQI